MLKRIKIDNYKTFIKPTSIDFSATNYKFLENENVGSNKSQNIEKMYLNGLFDGLPKYNKIFKD